ncbi:MAG: UDP-N-acetylmuramoyl-L-alanine--D-glutamate ligase [Flavobacteriales bacterium]|nr:UDP-N-acetylmuramoyl-L-alanine--D-glutamate ligase [Flavobacteriales bacterium]
MRIAILGAGESGVGAAILGKKEGLDVFVSDSGEIQEEYKNVLSKFEIKWEEKQHSEKEILNADEIIKSPGIPEAAEIIKKIRSKGIAIISEIEFASRYSNAEIIGITGSNGKTTTALLTFHILKKAGLKVELAGNIGKSFARVVAEEDPEYCVLELSSFQLDDIDKMKCDIAVLLNITPDHLDRYDYKMENYIASKFRICKEQDEECLLIYNSDDENITNVLKKNKGAAKLIPFTIKGNNSEGAHIEKEEIIINIKNHKQLNMSIMELALQGKHNTYNSMAAGIVAKVLDIRKEKIREGLSDFQNAEHRLEFVAKVHGIEFVNDSKATNINSSWYALESIAKPIIWIVGGVDKGNDYDFMSEIVDKRVKGIICLGEDTAKIHAAFEGKVEEIVDVMSAQEAVRQSYRMGTKGDVVLLSPACASFDLFENYEDRGHQFKQAVRAL